MPMDMHYYWVMERAPNKLCLLAHVSDFTTVYRASVANLASFSPWLKEQIYTFHTVKERHIRDKAELVLLQYRAR